MYFDIIVFHDFWLVSKTFLWFLVGAHDFSRYFHGFAIVNHAFFAKPPGPIFLRFIDNHMLLSLIVANHQSNDAMFSMYRSSLILTLCRPPGYFTDNADNLQIIWTLLRVAPLYDWFLDKTRHFKKWFFIKNSKQEDIKVGRQQRNGNKRK